MLNLPIDMSLVSKRRKIRVLNRFILLCIIGSPFTVNVGGHGSSRLRESITRERRAADITHIGSQCELSLKIPGKKKRCILKKKNVFVSI